MGFAALNPSLYERESVFCRCFVRNGPAWVATQAGLPIVGSWPIAALGAACRSKIAIGASSGPGWLRRSLFASLNPAFDSNRGGLAAADAERGDAAFEVLRLERM